MKKLTLDLNALEVEAFETAAPLESGSAALLTGPNACVTVSCGDSEIRACLF